MAAVPRHGSGISHTERRRLSSAATLRRFAFGVGALAVYLVGWVSTRWSLGTVYLFSSALLVLIVVNTVLLFAATRGRDLHNRPRA